MNISFCCDKVILKGHTLFNFIVYLDINIEMSTFQISSSFTPIRTAVFGEHVSRGEGRCF